MRLILTLLCRDEDDIIEQMLAFHLSRGVDLVIATDNGSRDGTRAILERYRRSGVLLLIDEPSLTHDQAPWVTRMARMAANDCGADWVINADAGGSGARVAFEGFGALAQLALQLGIAAHRDVEDLDR
ncbi:MAG: glycosyltransferase family 2 protein, partial [Prochlorococcaceae cyanobacterium]